jgi:hypothetical protein
VQYRTGRHAIKNSDFDLDYRNGVQGENLVNTLLTGGKTVEVKTDFKWVNTGNLYIETECWYVSANSWQPSGLSVTKAEYWAFVLAESVLIVPTKLLRLAVEIEGHPISCQIPPNQSRGYLIKPELLLQTNRKNPQS